MIAWLLVRSGDRTVRVTLEESGWWTAQEGFEPIADELNASPATCPSRPERDNPEWTRSDAIVCAKLAARKLQAVRTSFHALRPGDFTR